MLAFCLSLCYNTAVTGGNFMTNSTTLKSDKRQVAAPKRTPAYKSQPSGHAQRAPAYRSRSTGRARTSVIKGDERIKPAYTRKKKLALLLPGHNEELIIATTIQSAINAGQRKEDIYVVDDCSSDKTRKIAISLLGRKNVLTVGRSGKALAVQKAIAHFKIESRYVWLHIADADSIFSPDYFRVYTSKLDARKYAVALGFVQSMRGNW